MIFQKSLQSNELPSIWKKATVIPLHKKENCLDPLNYSPISLTCITCKILESIISDHILEHMSKRKIITSKQFGFLKRRFAESELLMAVENNEYFMQVHSRKVNKILVLFRLSQPSLRCSPVRSPTECPYVRRNSRI